MEVGVRLIGLVLRVLNFILAPLYWLRARDTRKVPPVTNPLLFKSVIELAASVRNGDITSEELLTVYIDRVKEVNPYINAVVEDRFQAALEDARQVDKQIAQARSEGNLEVLVKEKPLLGVPFTVKESCSLNGLSNSVGCLENAGRRATSDGTAVSLIKQAGAIPMLVSNTPELCLGWETTNLLKGTTNNPYDLNRTPGGSSGGESALLACGASPFSVASDIAGSIRLPAAFCGVVGHKPTPGVIPIQGHVPTLSDESFPKFLTVGPMVRKAEDLPLLMNIMAGKQNKLRLDEPVDLRKVKVHHMLEAAKSISILKVDKCITDAIQNAVKYLEKECGTTTSNNIFKELEESVEISVSVFFSMKDIPNMLQDPVNPKRDKSFFVELLKCFFGGGSRSLQGLCFTVLSRSQLFIPESRRGYYLGKANQVREHFQKVLSTNGVLLYPVFLCPAHYHNQVFLKASGVLYTMMFNILGMPATAVPMGVWRGMPVAIQVIAAPNQDRLCLAVAKQLEVGFGGWKPPQ